MIIRRIKCLARDTRGATAIEYGLIAALIVISMLGALRGFASETIDMWTAISNASAEAVAGG